MLAWETHTSWLTVVNPTRQAQTVRVAFLGVAVPERTLTVAARGREAVELQRWGATGAFGVEVTCGTVCAAMVAVWDRGMKASVLSPPLTGCVER